MRGAAPGRAPPPGCRHPCGPCRDTPGKDPGRGSRRAPPLPGPPGTKAAAAAAGTALPHPVHKAPPLPPSAGARRGSPSPHPGVRTDPSAAGRSAASLPSPGSIAYLPLLAAFLSFWEVGGLHWDKSFRFLTELTASRGYHRRACVRGCSSACQSKLPCSLRNLGSLVQLSG